MTTNESPGDPPAGDRYADVAASMESADPDEAAAVAVAIGAYLRERELTARADSDGAADVGWAGRKWQYADRLGRAADRSVRVPDDAPVDPWSAAGRVDRL